MQIKVRMEATVEIEDGEANINEILLAAGNLSRKVYLDVSKGIIETYQEQIVKMLCNGKGSASWVNHERKDMPGQICAGGNYRSGGVRAKERVLRTEMGQLHLKTQQIICKVCGKRFSVLLPLLKIPPRAKPTVKLTLMMAETVSDISYRKSSNRLEGLAEVVIPKTTLHTWMTNQNWEILTDANHTASNWESFRGILADDTGYKRQKADTKRGVFRLVMGVKDSPGKMKKLVPLGVWADKSWEEIESELTRKRPSEVKPPVVVTDGKDQGVLKNIVQSTQRCQWHLPNQLGFALWEDGLSKSKRDPLVKKLSGLIKIELPKDDYRKISPEIQKQVRQQLNESKKSIEKMIKSFQKKGFIKASTYLKNALWHIFTVVEKWLELGYMPPKVISLLERVMREMGRRIKKIGASWKEKGLLAIAHVMLTRIYTPQQWKQYWAKLLDLQNRCIVKSYHISFSIVSPCTIPGHY